MMQCGAIRSRAAGYPEHGAFPDPVSKLIDDERRQQFMAVGAHFESEYFVALTYLPPTEIEERAKGWLFEGRGAYDSSKTAAQHLERFIVLPARLKLGRERTRGDRRERGKVGYSLEVAWAPELSVSALGEDDRTEGE